MFLRLENTYSLDEQYKISPKSNKKEVLANIKKNRLIKEDGYNFNTNSCPINPEEKIKQQSEGHPFPIITTYEISDAPIGDCEGQKYFSYAESRKPIVISDSNGNSIAEIFCAGYRDDGSSFYFVRSIENKTDTEVFVIDKKTNQKTSLQESQSPIFLNTGSLIVIDNIVFKFWPNAVEYRIQKLQEIKCQNNSSKEYSDNECHFTGFEKTSYNDQDYINNNNQQENSPVTWLDNQAWSELKKSPEYYKQETFCINMDLASYKDLILKTNKYDENIVMELTDRYQQVLIETIQFLYNEDEIKKFFGEFEVDFQGDGVLVAGEINQQEEIQFKLKLVKIISYFYEKLTNDTQIKAKLSQINRILSMQGLEPYQIKIRTGLGYKQDDLAIPLTGSLNKYIVNPFSKKPDSKYTISPDLFKSSELAQAISKNLEIQTPIAIDTSFIETLISEIRSQLTDEQISDIIEFLEYREKNVYRGINKNSQITAQGYTFSNLQLYEFTLFIESKLQEQNKNKTPQLQDDKNSRRKL